MPVLAIALLSGCAGYETGDGAKARLLGFDFGNAVHHNAAVQIVDPKPMHADDAAPALDGKRAAAAIWRYQNGGVFEPEAESTSDNKVD
jgi:type IV pilus biogenesis protein CpaD/CtpE